MAKRTQQNSFFTEPLSTVDVGSCGANFPMKFSVDEQAMVPFRTIIPRQNGARAFVSSPSCGRSGQVERTELELNKANVSPDQSKLALTIRLRISSLLVPLLVPINVDLKYELERQ